MEYWYALYTKPRHEKKVKELLEEKQQTVYLPLITRVRLWKDRKKKVEMPLFSSYIFARFDYKNRFDLLHTPGVVKIVNFKGEPAIVPEWQIEAVRTMLLKPEKVHMENYMPVGQEVEVIDGPFKGMRGAVKMVKGCSRLVISIDGVMQTISVDVDPDMVKKIGGQAK